MPNFIQRNYNIRPDQDQLIKAHVSGTTITEASIIRDSIDLYFEHLKSYQPIISSDLAIPIKASTLIKNLKKGIKK